MNKLYFNHMNAAELFDRVFSIYKKSFLMQFLVTIIISIIVLPVVSLVMTILAGVGMLGGVISYINNPYSLNSYAMIGYIFIFSITFITFMGIFYAVIISANMGICKQAFYGEKLNLTNSLKFGLRSILKVLSVLLAELIIFIPIVGVIFGGFYLLMNFFENATFFYPVTSTPVAITIVVLTLLYLLVALFIYLSVSVFLVSAIPVTLFEKKYFFSAIAKSFTLAKKDYWRLFGTILCWSLVLSGTYYCVVSVFDVVTVILTLISNSFYIDMEPVVVGTTVFRFLISAGVNVLLAPLGSIFYTLVYFNQRIKHEGMDIEIGLDKLINEAKGEI